MRSCSCASPETRLCTIGQETRSTAVGGETHSRSTISAAPQQLRKGCSTMRSHWGCFQVPKINSTLNTTITFETLQKPRRSHTTTSETSCLEGTLKRASQFSESSVSLHSLYGGDEFGVADLHAESCKGGRRDANRGSGKRPRVSAHQSRHRHQRRQWPPTHARPHGRPSWVELPSHIQRPEDHALRSPPRAGETRKKSSWQEGQETEDRSELHHDAQQSVNLKLVTLTAKRRPQDTREDPTRRRARKKEPTIIEKNDVILPVRSVSQETRAPAVGQHSDSFLLSSRGRRRKRIRNRTQGLHARSVQAKIITSRRHPVSTNW